MTHAITKKIPVPLLQHTLDGLKNVRLMIVGDLLIDAYMKGRVDRISPEAPVPVVAYKGTEYKLGGAGNVLANCQCLGMQTDFYSIIGDDNEGAIALDLLAAQGVRTDGVLQLKERVTPLKTRVVAGQHQLLRIDRERCEDLSSHAASELMERMSDGLTRAKAWQSEGDTGSRKLGVLISDYAKGLFHAGTCPPIIAWAGGENLLTAIDPKEKNFALYTGATVMTPNLKEALHHSETYQDALSPEHFTLINEELLTKTFTKSEEQLKALYRLGEHMMTMRNLRELVMTLSEHGMALFEHEASSLRMRILPAVARTVHDVSGAGDTVIAAYTGAVLSGGDEAGLIGGVLANLAAGCAVSQGMTYAVKATDIQVEIARQAEGTDQAAVLTINMVEEDGSS